MATVRDITADQHDWDLCRCEDCQNESDTWYFKLTYEDRLNILTNAETVAWSLREAGSPIAFMFDALAEHIGKIYGVPGR